ncbi:MAG: ATP-binding cassette domain-containing protein [Ginsengibacter sp.]
MINVIKIEKSFGEKKVLNSLSQDFITATVHGIIGLNGAGKTTFFNILSTFLKPDTGEILYEGKKITRNDIAYLETVIFFYSNITGKEYLEIFPSSNLQFDLDNINKLLKLPLDEIIETYSTGMKKKLALLAIIKQDKPIYIFDEPYNGLDLETNMALEIIIKNLHAKQKTVFISSHILSPLINVCNEIHLLQQGNFIKNYFKENFNLIEQELFADFSKSAADIIASSI